MIGAPLIVSASLLNSALVRRGPPPDRVVEAYESGAISTTPSPGAGMAGNRHIRRVGRWLERRRQSSPDRAASMARRRTLGGSGALPNAIRHGYTEGERAALTIIALEAKQYGACALPLDEIAAKAGVSRTTVQNALREARARAHVSVQERPRKGQKSLTNVVRIIAPEWLVWLNRGPNSGPGIGFKPFHPTKSRIPEGRNSKLSLPGHTGLGAVGNGAKRLSEEAGGRSPGPEPSAGAAK